MSRIWFTVLVAVIAFLAGGVFLPVLVSRIPWPWRKTE